MVWDRILNGENPGSATEEWGGISYALEALSVALPEGWVIQPLLQVGEDLADRAIEYLETIPRVELTPGVRVVPFRNHKVDLHYENQERRLERITGSVPPWTWEELEPLIQDIDALYLNFITGFEFGLETARCFRGRVSVPLYADLHSLFLGRAADGHRFPQELPDWLDWFRAFDAVQMNDQEFEILGRAWGDPWGLATDTVGPELKLITVTMGSRGAAYVAAPEFTSDPTSWPGARGSPGKGEVARMGEFPLPDGSMSGDPTGCGDVWGATFFARLLGGDSLDEAMVGANRIAAKNLEHRGARGLRHVLRGVLGS